MKTLKKLNENEKIEIVKAIWSDEKMQNYCITTYDYYATPDNLYMEIEKANKLTIRNVLYYDDEFKAPEKSFDNFLENNYCQLKYDHLKEMYDDENNIFYFVQFYGGNREKIVGFTNRKIYENDKNQIRLITGDELADLLEIHQTQQDEYIKRLKKYFNRYYDKIKTRGYWVNR